VALGLPLAVSVLATGLSVAAGEVVPDFTSPPVYELYPLPPTLAETGLVVLFPTIFVQTLLFSSPMGEELGWRGYALPRLQARETALRASVVLGVVWATWHLPLFLTPGDPLASEPLLGWVTDIVAYAVLFTWLFNNTGGSLFLALLFHTAIAVTGLFVSAAEVVPVLDDLLTAAIVLLVLYRYGPRTLTRESRRSAATG
jgi:membrane protease YdiL (CAAX protease family)